ncbi:MAG: hypothetical protein ACJA0M_000715, partial [Chitinophagales bacterium]
TDIKKGTNKRLFYEQIDTKLTILSINFVQ